MPEALCRRLAALCIGHAKALAFYNHPDADQHRVSLDYRYCKQVADRRPRGFAVTQRFSAGQAHADSATSAMMVV